MEKLAGPWTTLAALVALVASMYTHVERSIEDTETRLENARKRRDSAIAWLRKCDPDKAVEFLGPTAPEPPP